jgi:undecaprenyl-diphosphatase
LAKSVIEKPVTGWRQKITNAQAIASPAWRRYRAAIFQGYLIAAIVLFAVLAVLAHTVAYFTFDLVLTREIQTFHGIGFSTLMWLESWLGYSPQSEVLVALAFVFLLVSGLKWEAMMVLFADLSISLIGTAIKLVVVRPRPDPDLVNVITRLPDYGFPSGHVLFFVTFFGFLGFLAYTLLKPAWERRALVALCGIPIALIGVSRIYLGAHWASDVLAAYLLGSIWLTLCVHIYRWGKPRFSANQPVAKETPPVTRTKEK